MKLKMAMFFVTVVIGSSAAPAKAANEVSVRPLAEKTLKGIQDAEKVLYYAIKSRDAAAIKDRVVWPLLRLMGDWPTYAEAVKTEIPLFACNDAADHLRNMAELMLEPDDAEVAETRDYHISKYKIAIASCEKLMSKE